MQIAVKPLELVDRRVDPWLVGWLGVAVWVAAEVARLNGVWLSDSATTVIFWFGAGLTAAHFGVSYHLAYGYGAVAARARPLPLIVFPAVLAVGLTSAALAVRSTGSSSDEHALASTAITAVFLLTTWHYIKQTYGVGRVAAQYGGVRLGRREIEVLRFGLYPLWILNAAQILRTDGTYSIDGYAFGWRLLSPSAIEPIRIVAIVALIPMAIVFLRILRRGALPLELVGAYLVSALWLLFPPTPVATALILAPIHALQYLAISHRAELGLAVKRGMPTSFGWWLNIAAAVTAGGLLASRWLPPFIDRHLDPQAPLLASAMFFAFLNLHHYVIDASVWRARGTLLGALATSRELQPAASPLRSAASSSAP